MKKYLIGLVSTVAVIAFVFSSNILQVNAQLITGSGQVISGLGQGTLTLTSTSPTSAGTTSLNITTATSSSLVLGVIRDSSNACKVNLNWNPVTGATGYNVYRTDNQQQPVYGPFLPSTTTPTVLAPVLFPPVSLTTSLNNTLTWGSVSNATSYNIYRSSDTGVTYGLVASTTATSITLGGYTNPQASYLYEVSAVNTAGESAKSPAVGVNSSISYTKPVASLDPRTQTASAWDAVKSVPGKILQVLFFWR